MANALHDGFTIGVGLTDRCNANCPHCYSRPTQEFSDIDYHQLTSFLFKISIKSINFGTGESILYPRFMPLVKELAQRDIALSVTTNGYSVENMSDQELALFHDVDFSIDFPDSDLNDRWRGCGSHKSIIKGAHRCRDLGVEASLVTCLMRENHTYMGALVELASQLGLSLRVNVYKPVFTRAHSPTYEQFWQAIADLANGAYFTSCSEPVVKAALGQSRGINGSPCGKRSFRIHPDGKVVACVYLNHSQVTISDLGDDFEANRLCLSEKLDLKLPEICQACNLLSLCAGGCASRRILSNPQAPDEYCFVVKGELPQISARWKASKGLVHEDYLCTMIFSA